MLKKFDEQIEKLKTRLIKMGSLVEEQLNLAIRAINLEDASICDRIFEDENIVDKIDLKIEKDCQKLFALNQPVALDLRLIISAINLSTDLERIGDLAKNIAERFLRTKKKPDFLAQTNFIEMSETALSMLKDALDSFIYSDVEKAKQVIIGDKKLDELNFDNDKKLIEIMKQNPLYIEYAVDYLYICHQLERCGDHATNVAEDVFFISEANIIKHKYEKFIFNDENSVED